MKANAITIIIPVLNGSKHISRCIDSIQSMVSSHDISIIVIDNGSTDDTIDILNKYKIKYEVVPNKTISEIRNMGVSLANTEYIGLVDSDCLVDKNWASNAIDILDSNSDIGIVGRFYDLGDNPTWVEKAWIDRRKGVIGPVDFLPAGNMVFRKELFLKVGGFSQQLVTGEDYELCERVRLEGFSVYNTPEVNVRHLGNCKRLRDIIRKEKWYGLGMFGCKTPFRSKPLLLSMLFITNIVVLIYLLLQTSQYIWVPLLLITVIVLITAIKFTCQATDNRLNLFLKMIPIATCYLIGRSLSIITALHIRYKVK